MTLFEGVVPRLFKLIVATVPDEFRTQFTESQASAGIKGLASVTRL